MKDNRSRLIHEQEKLNALIDKALENGTPLCETHEIMMQCKKIHELMFETEAADMPGEKV